MSASFRRILAGAVVGTMLSAASAWAAPPVGASTWTVRAQPSSAQAQSNVAPGPPTGVTASCNSLFGTTVTVSWAAVVRAASYTVWESTTSATSGYTAAASGLTGLSSAFGSLANGSHWFEVSAGVGVNWVGPPSPPSAQITISLGFLCF